MDTSALMAILLGEPEAESCIDALATEADILLSAGTAAEALIVAGRRGLGDEMARLIAGVGFQVLPVTGAAAERIALAYGQRGKGVHRAGLNFGDCFAYELAKKSDCSLLFVGDDFNHTDLTSVL